MDLNLIFIIVVHLVLIFLCLFWFIFKSVKTKILYGAIVVPITVGLLFYLLNYLNIKEYIVAAEVVEHVKYVVLYFILFEIMFKIKQRNKIAKRGSK